VDREAGVGSRRTVSATGLFVLLLLFATPLPLASRGKEKLTYGEGLIVNVPLPESELEQIVADVAQNGVIRGTKEYNKDEFVAGAKAASSSRVFPAWSEGGKVFYKVREQVIDPRNFKDTNDVGTLAVRYVLQAQGEKNTVLRIDALFEEEFRHVVHQSDGSVENAEYKDIREHCEALELMKKQDTEAGRQRQERLAKKQSLGTQADGQAWPVPQSEPLPSAPEGTAAATEIREDVVAAAATESAGQSLSSQNAPGNRLSGQSLEEHIKDLRKQVERLVKAPGAPLKSAPFHTASTLESLTPGTEILILISTPYWYGVETHDGQHGWIMRDQLEQP
jgi:hypothetical protein